MKYLASFLVALTAVGVAQAPVGQWHDLSKDSDGQYLFIGNASGSTKTILTEEYEVIQTHEICAAITGYFMEKSQQGRYMVSFKGMRTSAQFTFTTQYDAEHWVTKWCTPDSLHQITAGKGTFARSY